MARESTREGENPYYIGRFGKDFAKLNVLIDDNADTRVMDEMYNCEFFQDKYLLVHYYGYLCCYEFNADKTALTYKSKMGITPSYTSLLKINEETFQVTDFSPGGAYNNILTLSLDAEGKIN